MSLQKDANGKKILKITLRHRRHVEGRKFICMTCSTRRITKGKEENIRKWLKKDPNMDKNQHFEKQNKIFFSPWPKEAKNLHVI